MIGIWFTYNLDAKALTQSIKSFRRVYPNGIVGICDDSNNPVISEIIQTIAPDYYELRLWNSKGNLNGWEAIRGILEFQVKMHDLFPGHEGALKIDSDTLILDNSWLDPKLPAVGFSLGTQTIMAGMIRYLRSDVPQELLNYLKERWLWETFKTPEDVAIATYCALMYGRECNSINWTDGARSYSYVKPELNDKSCKVITFGNRKEITDMPDDQKRNVVGEAMNKYLEKLYNFN